MKMFARIIEIWPIQEFGEKWFQKQVVELEEIDSDWMEMRDPDRLLVDVFGSMLDYVWQRKVGDLVECWIAFWVNKAKTWDRKFNNVRLYKILKMPEPII